MSNPVPITAMDITGYILLGTKRLNIRLTLDDIVPSYIEDGTTNKNQTEDERLTDENGQDELADEDQDELADEDQDELADEDQDELADEDEDEGAVSSVPGVGGEESEAEYRETEGPNGHHTADDSVGSLRRLLHPRTRQNREIGRHKAGSEGSTRQPAADVDGQRAGRVREQRRGDAPGTSRRSSNPGKPSRASGRDGSSGERSARRAGSSSAAVESSAVDQPLSEQDSRRDDNDNSARRERNNQQPAPRGSRSRGTRTGR